MPVFFDLSSPAPFPPKAIVTGASGFVGRALMKRLGNRSSALSLGGEDWRERIASAPLRDATLFHLAARVHRDGDADELFERDNVEKSVALGEAAASRGARRLVFLSSIKVNGEETRGTPFRPADREAPADAYARSKWRAEGALREISRRSGLSIAIVRSPLVLGEGAGGNLRSLMKLADGPWPLPFGSVGNRRTLVHVDDLAALLCLCSESAHAEGRLFFAGDPDAVSTPRLVRSLRMAFGRPARLAPLAPRVLERMAALLGQSERMGRLTRSLEVDVSETRRDLGWRPEVPIEEAIARMARAFRAESRSG